MRHFFLEHCNDRECERGEGNQYHHALAQGYSESRWNRYGNAEARSWGWAHTPHRCNQAYNALFPGSRYEKICARGHFMSRGRIQPSCNYENGADCQVAQSTRSLCLCLDIPGPQETQRCLSGYSASCPDCPLASIRVERRPKADWRNGLFSGRAPCGPG